MAVSPSAPTFRGAPTFRAAPARRSRRGSSPIVTLEMMASGLLWALPQGVLAGVPGSSVDGQTTPWPILPTSAPVAVHSPAPAPRPVLGSSSLVQVDRARRTITLTAEARPSAFLASTDPDDRYHALVSRSGGAVAKALMVTDAEDHQIAQALRSLGAEDAGGVPMSAWNRRAIPFLPGPGSRVAGTRVEVLITWEGADRSYTLGELLGEEGPGEVEIRFGGNEEHDHHWPSGCIICLYSCPGGVLSNALKTIRDHSRGHTFAPGDLFPPDGTTLTVTLQLLPG